MLQDEAFNDHLCKVRYFFTLMSKDFTMILGRLSISFFVSLIIQACLNSVIIFEMYKKKCKNEYVE